MLTKHCTDEEIQQYAIAKEHGEKWIAGHIHVCSECRIKMEVYQLLITGIKQQPKPAFDFDLAAMVLQQLPLPKLKASTDKWLIWQLASIGLGFIGVAYYFLADYFDFLKEIQSILIYLIVITAITILAYVLMDMYKKYRQEMKVLDLY